MKRILLLLVLALALIAVGTGLGTSAIASAVAGGIGRPWSLFTPAAGEAVAGNGGTGGDITRLWG